MKNFFSTISNNILLSNLIIIRWIAIFGQLSTILVVFYFIKISIPIFACSSIVLISVLVNIFSYLIKKNNNYLTDNKAFYFLLFDTLQLGILLYLTGGIYNPFTFLLIAPLIISASYLPVVFSIILSFLSIIIVIFINYFYIPIEWNDTFNLPSIFKYGLTLSLLISLIFIAIYVYLFAQSSRGISRALSETRAVLANQKKLSEVGSLSAAAVHELSTPLNTIFLIINDLLTEDSTKNNPRIQKEVNLLKSQAERCKEILLSLSKNPQNLKNNFLDTISISNLVKLSFEKFNNKNNVLLEIKHMTIGNEPTILSKDELIYGIGNIIQNAIQHACNKIKVSIIWDKKYIKIIIQDNGKGFTKETLEQIGNPYISKNKKGMGLGIFIAKNLIENIGGVINFKNNEYNSACVEIKIKRND